MPDPKRSDWDTLLNEMGIAAAPAPEVPVPKIAATPLEPVATPEHYAKRPQSGWDTLQSEFGLPPAPPELPAPLRSKPPAPAAEKPTKPARRSESDPSLGSESPAKPSARRSAASGPSEENAGEGKAATARPPRAPRPAKQRDPVDETDEAQEPETGSGDDPTEVGAEKPARRRRSRGGRGRGRRKASVEATGEGQASEDSQGDLEGEAQTDASYGDREPKPTSGRAPRGGRSRGRAAEEASASEAVEPQKPAGRGRGRSAAKPADPESDSGDQTGGREAKPARAPRTPAAPAKAPAAAAKAPAATAKAETPAPAGRGPRPAAEKSSSPVAPPTATPSKGIVPGSPKPPTPPGSWSAASLSLPDWFPFAGRRNRTPPLPPEQPAELVEAPEEEVDAAAVEAWEDSAQGVGPVADEDWASTSDAGENDQEQESDQESEQGEGAPRRRRKRRRRRSSGGGSVTEETRSSAEARGGRRAEEDRDDDEEDEDDDEFEVTGGPPLGDEDDDEDDQDGELAGVGASGTTHKKIPSWADAIGVIVDANIAARSDRQRSGRTGSRGGQRPRGGRGRRRKPTS